MDLHDKIAEFLRSQKGGRFCDECILKEVGADLGDVPKEPQAREIWSAFCRSSEASAPDAKLLKTTL